jgi:hypothetical protein
MIFAGIPTERSILIAGWRIQRLPRTPVLQNWGFGPIVWQIAPIPTFGDMEVENLALYPGLWRQFTKLGIRCVQLSRQLVAENAM